MHPLKFGPQRSIFKKKSLNVPRSSKKTNKLQEKRFFDVKSDSAKQVMSDIQELKVKQIPKLYKVLDQLRQAGAIPDDQIFELHEALADYQKASVVLDDLLKQTESTTDKTLTFGKFLTKSHNLLIRSRTFFSKLADAIKTTPQDKRSPQLKTQLKECLGSNTCLFKSVVLHNLSWIHTLPEQARLSLPLPQHPAHKRADGEVSFEESLRDLYVDSQALELSFLPIINSKAVSGETFVNDWGRTHVVLKVDGRVMFDHNPLSEKSTFTMEFNPESAVPQKLPMALFINAVRDYYSSDSASVYSGDSGLGSGRTTPDLSYTLDVADIKAAMDANDGVEIFAINANQAGVCAAHAAYFYGLASTFFMEHKLLIEQSAKPMLEVNLTEDGVEMTNTARLGIKSMLNPQGEPLLETEVKVMIKFGLDGQLKSMEMSQVAPGQGAASSMPLGDAATFTSLFVDVFVPRDASADEGAGAGMAVSTNASHHRDEIMRRAELLGSDADG